MTKSITSRVVVVVVVALVRRLGLTLDTVTLAFDLVSKVMVVDGEMPSVFEELPLLLLPPGGEEVEVAASPCAKASSKSRHIP